MAETNGQHAAEDYNYACGSLLHEPGRARVCLRGYEDGVGAGITGDVRDAWIWRLNTTMFLV